MFPKTCSCCFRRLTETDWNGLQYLGRMGGDRYGVLELRLCSCGTSLAVKVREPLKQAA